MKGKSKYTGKMDIFRALGPNFRDSETGRCLRQLYETNPAAFDAAFHVWKDNHPVAYAGLMSFFGFARQLEYGIDPLTGLRNRRYFNEALDAELRRSKRTHNPFALGYVDVDHFKRINDAHLHEGGDRVLRSFADVIRANTRDGFDAIARYGGEEFAVLWPHTDEETALALAERLRAAAESNIVELSSGEKISYTVSTGIAAYPFDRIETTAELLHAADRALYNAKHGGRNRVASAARLRDETIAKLKAEKTG